MNLQQLAHYRLLAEIGNLTRTAEQLYVSAPSLSAELARLEKELGCQLFDRVGRSLQLNDNGRILYRHACKALDSINTARVELREISNEAEQSLTLGVTSTLVGHRVIGRFISLYPKIHFNQRILKIAEQRDPLLYQQVDLILTGYNNLPRDEWLAEPLPVSSHSCLAVYPSHPFASRESIRLEEARDERFILLSREYSYREFSDRLFEQAGFRPNVVIECEFALRRALLEAEYGILLATSTISHDGELGDAVFIPITDPPASNSYSLYHSSRCQMRHAACQFRDFLIDYFRTSNL